MTITNQGAYYLQLVDGKATGTEAANGQTSAAMERARQARAAFCLQRPAGDDPQVADVLDRQHTPSGKAIPEMTAQISLRRGTGAADSVPVKAQE